MSVSAEKQVSSLDMGEYSENEMNTTIVSQIRDIFESH